MYRKPTHLFLKWTMAALSLMLAISVVGCQSDAPQRTDQDVSLDTAPDPTASAIVTNTDECATRLHEYSGALLLYYFFTGDLPQALDELVAVDPDGELPEAICPVSRLPYVYRPEGLMLAERNEQVVLHDPAPSHSGIRWAVTLGAEDEAAGRVTKVIALPNSFFLLEPPVIPLSPQPRPQPPVDN